MSKKELNKKSRCFLYSPDCLEGKIFTGADAINAALADGWVDNPDDARAKAKAIEVQNVNAATAAIEKAAAEGKAAAAKPAAAKSKPAGGANKAAANDNSK